MKPYYRDEYATLFLGDCLEVLPQLRAEGIYVDAVITDPPYGVNLGSDPTHIIGNRPYNSFSDTPENVRLNVIPAIQACIDMGVPVLCTPGTRCLWLYPEPREIGCIYFPAGAGYSRWGFTCSQPILFYGNDPFMPLYKKPNSFQCTSMAEKNGHPCPKPLSVMRWMVNRCSHLGQIILDPFAGSGTTGVAAKSLGRKSILIEISEAYCEIAAKRLEKTHYQPSLLLEPEHATPLGTRQIELGI